MTANDRVEAYPSADDVLAEALQNAEVRAQWEQTRLARDVALWLVRHRGEHGLTQSALAQQLGWKQPVVARLERGDHEPSMATLQHLVRTLGGSARISIDGDNVRLVVRRPRSLRRLRMPASLESLEDAAHTVSMSESALEATTSQTSDEKMPRSRYPKLSIEKIRGALLERAARDEEHITQELIAEDLGSTSGRLRKILSGSGWDAEVRRARRLALEGDTAKGK
jgi:transcriptional regulator with XRE-family HTH domain